MPFEPASDVLAHYHRARSDARALRADLRAPARRLGRQRHQDRGPGGRASAGMGGPRDGPDFQNLHRNKRSMTLNLKDPKGVEIFKRLAAKADVIVENYRPDVKTRLGIDYDAISEINPRIIYGSISGFGQDGPYRDRPGFDQIAQGMGGLMSITGEPGRGPMRVGIPIADLSAGIFCAQGILLALIERERSGKGQWVQTSLLQAQVFMLDFQAARWTDGRRSAGPGRQRSSDQRSRPACSRPRTATSTSPPPASTCGRGSRSCSPIPPSTIPTSTTPSGRSKHRKARQRADRAHTSNGHRRRLDRQAQRRRHPRAARSTPSTRCSPTRRCSISAWRRTCRATSAGPPRRSAQPIKMSRSKSTLVKPPPLMGEHTDEILPRRRLFGRRDRRPVRRRSGRSEPTPQTANQKDRS